MLKSLNISELERLGSELDKWSGARLQEVSGNENEIGLMFYRGGEKLFLWADLSRTPMLLFFTGSFPNHRKKLKPIDLFLRAHFIGLKLSASRVNAQLGRVIFLTFEGGDSESAVLELRLFPGGQNVIATYLEKKISWARVEEIAIANDDYVPTQIRTNDELCGQWLESRSKNGTKASKDLVSQLAKDIEKKERAVRELQAIVDDKNDEKWQRAGLWLQAFGAVDFPKNISHEHIALLNLEESLSWNMQFCFKCAEKEKAKKKGRNAQLDKLKNEILVLKNKLEKPATLGSEPQLSPKKGLLQQASAQGRTKQLGNGIVALKGKSAKDNLAILRAAKPWYLWLHLRDEPSAHMVVQFNKGQEVADSVLFAAIAWLVGNCESEKTAVVVAECRHVKPIKGDRLGRVHFRNERTLIYSAKTAR